MFERYTERSRRVIFFARYEALQYGSQSIAPEHILLGLLREDRTIIARYFPFRTNLTAEKIRREVEDRIAVRDRIPQSAELQLSADTKKALFYANEESRSLKNRQIGPEHILIGLIREESSVAAEVLFQFDLRVQDIRDVIVRNSGAGRPSVQPGEEVQKSSTLESLHAISQETLKWDDWTRS